MRRKLRRVGALALVIAMLLSTFAESLAADTLQDSASALSAVSPLADGDTATTPTNFDASADVTGKPRIYVDFLGDNNGHNENGTANLGTLTVSPQSEHWYTTDTAAEPNKWSKYTDDSKYYGGDGSETIFYVGVGIDRAHLLKALEDDAPTVTTDPDTGEEIVTYDDAGGVYSFEAGFYYNPVYVEPYVGANGYADTIESINLSGTEHLASGETNAHWDGENYRVVEALTGIDPRLDPQFDSGIADLDGDGVYDDWGELTQEEIDSPYDPTNEGILNGIWSNQLGWRMTYVSIEMTKAALEEALANPTDGDARLEGVYGETDTNEYDGENTTEYLLIIPFVLKKYDDRERLCFRLIRNATHFTLGSMDGGNVNYAAWERVTSRNSESNLKLQTTFTGDLNIFTGEKFADYEYTYSAELRVEKSGAPNVVEVGITGDPSPNPVLLTTDGQVMTGLAGGTGLTVHVEPQNRFYVTVNVYAKKDPSTSLATLTPPYDPNDPYGVRVDTDFTFVMPEADVIIVVTFTLDPNEPRNYDVTLVEDNRLGLDVKDDPSPVGRPPSTDPKVAGNYTSITATKLLSAGSTATSAPETIHSDTGSPVNDRGPYVTAGAGTTVSVETQLHNDYYAVIRFRREGGGTVDVQTSLVPTTEDGVTVLRIYTTGTYAFTMPPSDVDVEIDYIYAPHYQAKLEIIHVDESGNKTTINTLNRAQLSTIGYDDANVEERHYGKVWQDRAGDDTYSTTPDAEAKDIDGITPVGHIYPVPIAASTVTGSISGDKKPPSPYTETDSYPQVSIEPISVRAGREVRVAVEASSAYVIDSIVDSLGNTVDRVAVIGTNAEGKEVVFYATKDANYSNIYTFTMPDYPVKVEVYYTLRTAPELTLKVDDLAEAKVEVSANVYAEDDIYPKTDTITTNNEVMYNVLAGGTVTVTIVKVPEGYTAKVIVVTDEGNYLVATVPSSAAYLTSGAKVYFTMPNEDATVNISFVKEQEDEYTAHIFVTDIDGGYVAGSQAYFDTESGQSAIITGPAGTPLPGVVRVPAGYYIHAVTAVGASTAYPFTQSGNGWANGAATDVYINSSMPNEDIFITAIIKQGPPPVDPSFALSLYVTDDDNTKPVDNYATMRVDATSDKDGTERVKVADYAPLPDNTYATVDTAYPTAGTVVYVHVKHEADFYVKSVTVSPAYLGVDIDWVTDSVFRFTMPEGSIAVDVEFAKRPGEDPTPEEIDEYTKQLTIDKTENGVYNPTVVTDNTVDSLNYNHLTDNTTVTSGIDLEDDNFYKTATTVNVLSTVTVDVSVAEGWHVGAARLIYNGHTYYLTLSDKKTDEDFTLTFVMPTVDAKLVLDYREGDAPTAGEHLLTIVVDDPYNTGADTVDNYAQLLVDHLDGSTTPPIGPVGLGTTGGGIISDSDIARVGDTVTISWSADAAEGYTLELIDINAAGSAIAPQYVRDALGNTTATFTMPDADTTVLVRFTKGGERLYRADLVIYDPDDTANVVDNRASFNPLSDVDPDIYIKGDYVTSLHAGEGVTVYIEAVDGYYIDSVTVTPYSTGVTTTLSGAFGKQTAAFNMPAADVQVNVTFLKAWPSDPDDPDDAAKFDVLLTVVDQSMKTTENYAHSFGTGATDTSNVVGGETRVPVARLADGQIGNIQTHRGTLSYIEKVEIYDAAGNAVNWWWSAQYANTIAFNMPPTDIEVIVTYKTVAKEDDLPKYSATLHVSGRNSAVGSATLEVVSSSSSVSVSVGGTNPAEGSGTISGIFAGELLNITVPTPTNENYIVSSVYAIRRDTNTVLVLYSGNPGGESLVAGGKSPRGGGSATFSMPMALADVSPALVDVYVVFDKALEPYQAIASLEVSGPAGSGSAELLEWRGDDPYDPNDTFGLTSTGAVVPAGSSYIVLGEALTARVDITPAANHAIKSVTVVDRDGVPVEFDWILTNTAYDTESGVKTPLASIEYQQPAGGSWVKVEFEPIDTTRKYTARVVVNNGGSASNGALISGIDAISLKMTGWVKLIENATPNTIIDLQITCAQGYRFDVTVLPQSHNIHPTLPNGDTRSQQTGFLMPADDVIVYVRFEADTRTRHNATLSVYSDVLGSTSSASIASEFSGSKIADVGETVSVQALPNDEWITVTPHPGAGEYLKSVTVQTVSGIPVLYTIDAIGRIRFPMAEENVEIAVTFTANQPTYSVHLYAVATADFISESNGTATITAAGKSVSKEAMVSQAGTPAEITGVVAGERVSVAADLSPAALASSDAVYYIDSAYAEYRDGPYKGQRIALTVKDATYVSGLGEFEEIIDAWFTMQPYDIDVYVRYGKVEDVDAPAERNIKLEIYGDDGSGTASLVGGEKDILNLAATPAGRADITTAYAGDQMVMTIVVDNDYEIDYISVTPIGLDLKWQQATGPNDEHIYIFEMPDEDTTIQIHLRKRTTTDYEARLHVLNVGSGTIIEPDTAELYYRTDEDHVARGDGSKIDVPEAQQVDVKVYINNTGYYVLSAYVLTETGSMVRLYGTTLENVTLDPNLVKSAPEATAQFIMPSSDVDVYITITDIQDMPEEWTTVALVATDGESDGTLTNIGKRTAVISEHEEDYFLYEIDYAAGSISDRLSATEINHGYVRSFGNAGHKAYIVEVDGSEKRINLNEGSRALAPEYEFSHPATLTSSGIQAPTLNDLTYLPYSYYYYMPVDDTVTRMHYVKTTAVASDLRVEIIDGENPSDNTVTNRVSVSAEGNPTLDLESVTSAGAWQVISPVTPGGSVTFVVNPEHKEDAVVVVTLIDDEGNEVPITLTPNGDGTYSGSFEMPNGDATLRVEIAYSSVTLTIYDYTEAGGSSATMNVPVTGDTLTVPVGAGSATYGVDEVMTAAVISGAEVGDTSLTLSGIPNKTHTETIAYPAEGATITAIIGRDGTGRTTVLAKDIAASASTSDTGWQSFSTYGDSEVTVIVEEAYEGEPERQRFHAIVNLVNANDGEREGASIINNTSPQSQYVGEIWTTAFADDKLTLTFTVGEGRYADLSGTNDASFLQAFKDYWNSLGNTDGDDIVERVPAGTYTFEVGLPENAGATEDLVVEIRYYESPKLSFAVVDATGVYDSTGSGLNNTASITTTPSGGTAVTRTPSYTSDGSVHNGIVTVGGVEATWALNEGDLFLVDAKAVSDSSEVVKIYYETSAGITEIANNSSFPMPNEDTTVWVVFGDSEGDIYPPDPEPDPKPLYTTTLVVDPESTDGWADAGNSLVELLNMTDADSFGSTLMKYGAVGDEMRGSFVVVEGWYAVVTATDAAGVVTYIRQNSGNAETVTVTQPESDVTIKVRFVELKTGDTEPVPQNTLSFSIIGHDGQPGNTAQLTINGAYGGNDNPKVLAGAAGVPDRYTVNFDAEVAYATQLELEAKWAEGYSVKKITVEITSGGVTTVYTVAGSEYNELITAWMSMPDVSAEVCVYYGREYTATLHYEFRGGSGRAEMYDAANKDDTVVTIDGGVIDNLSGGEIIRTEPEIYAGSRLVNVVYETPLTGAHLTSVYTSDDLDGDSVADLHHDFFMPEEDTDVYVVFEPENGTSYIAAVALEGETAVAGNDAVIANVSDASAVGTQYWTTAQSGETIEITVSLAEGYQAKVVETKLYPSGLYVTRTLFRLDGEVTSFTMPLASDAVVTIEFIKGYTASLILKDSSGVSNSAHMTDNSTTVSAESAANGDVTYTKSDGTAPETVASGSEPDTAANKISEIGIGTPLDGDVVLGTGSKLYRLLYTTATGGTYNVGDARLLLDSDEAALPRTGAATVDWAVNALAKGEPVEDITITAVVVPADANPLIAKVQLEGDSDINLNDAIIADTNTAGSWLTGSIWTTTAGGNTVETTITLASGYSALITVINDTEYYAALQKFKSDNATDLASGKLTEADAIKYARDEARMSFTLIESSGSTPSSGESLSATESGAVVRVTMPTDSDITVILEFNGEPGPRPYAPNNDAYIYNNVTYLEQGWIYGTNRGDYATITVPTLFTDVQDKDALDILDDVYRPDDPTTTDVNELWSNLFRISVWVEKVQDFVDLGTNELIFTPVSEPAEYAGYPYNVGTVEDTGYPYNADMFYQGWGQYDAANNGAATDDSGYKYNGALFNVELAELPAGTTPSAAYEAFAAILAGDNGSYSTRLETGGTLLKIYAVSSDGRISDSTQLVIPPYYSLEGTIVSYAPMHDATFTLYELDADGEYSTEPHTVDTLEQDYGVGKWMQNFAIRSSDLGGRSRTSVKHDIAALVGDALGAYSSPTGEGTTPPTYKLTIEKAAVVTYERTGIALEIVEGVAVGGYSDSTTLRSWILGREVESDEPVTDVEIAAYTVSEGASGSSNDSYFLGADAELVYGVSEDVNLYQLDASGSAENDPVYPVGEDAAFYTVSDSATLAEEPAPTGDGNIKRDMIILITGDVNEDGYVIHIDRNTLYDYMNYRDMWTTDDESGVGWSRSVFNPETLAYRCDINGDGAINSLDLTALHDGNYNKSQQSYGGPSGLIRQFSSEVDAAIASFLASMEGSQDLSDFLPPDEPTESLSPPSTELNEELAP